MPPQIDLRKVTIEYCKNDKLWRKVIDLDKVGGLWWDNSAASGSGTNYVPYTEKVQVGDCPHPAFPFATPSGCWWDNVTKQWVCPDNLG